MELVAFKAGKVSLVAAPVADVFPSTTKISESESCQVWIPDFILGVDSFDHE